MNALKNYKQALVALGFKKIGDYLIKISGVKFEVYIHAESNKLVMLQIFRVDGFEVWYNSKKMNYMDLIDELQQYVKSE